MLFALRANIAVPYIMSFLMVSTTRELPLGLCHMCFYMFDCFATSNKTVQVPKQLSMILRHEPIDLGPKQLFCNSEQISSVPKWLAIASHKTLTIDLETETTLSALETSMSRLKTTAEL